MGNSLAGTLLYNQPAQSPVQSAFISSVNGGGGFTTADAFDLSQTGSITDIRWQGSYANPKQGPDFVASAAATRFSLGFFECITADCRSNSAVPGGTLLLTVADTHQNFAGFQSNFAGSSFGLLPDPVGLSIYDYEASLSAPFDLAAGRYLFAVTALLPDPQLLDDQIYWYWNGGAGGDSFALLDRGEVRFDGAFALSGAESTPAPEPSSSLLLVAGAVMIFAGRKRREAVCARPAMSNDALVASTESS